MAAYINTFSGRTINLAAPSHEDIDIGDIAHALSLLCRFNGHCREFYSVAEHSVRVSLLLEDLAKDYGHEEHTQKLCLMGLLHDAAEAYPPGDIAAPLKKLLQDEYGEDGLNALDVQDRFNERIHAHFDLGEPFEAAGALIELADRMLLAWEWRDVMGCDPDDGIGNPHTEEVLIPWSPGQAELSFLKRFQDLAPRYPLLGCFQKLIDCSDDCVCTMQLPRMLLKEADRIGRAQGSVTIKATRAGFDVDPQAFAQAVKETLPVRRKGEERPSVRPVTELEDGAIPMDQSRDQKKKRKKKKRKKGRKAYSPEEVERMIAAVIDRQAVDSMSAPKRGAPGSSPDCAQPVPKRQRLGPTKAERLVMDDPDVRERESEKVKGGGGLGAAAYGD